MKTLAIDIETYSSVSLQKAGVYDFTLWLRLGRWSC